MQNAKFVFDPGEIADILNQVITTGTILSPRRLTLELTKRCNLDCPFCWRANIENEEWEELGDAALISLVEQASLLGIKTFHLIGGGEPFVRREVCQKIIKKIKQFGGRGSIITNGTLFDRRSIELISSCGWDEVIISLDAPHAELHDYMRRKEGIFEKIKQAIKEFQKIKKTNKQDTPRIMINFIITAVNYKYIREMFSFMKELSIKMIKFLPFTLYNQNLDYFILDDLQKKRAE